MGCVEKATNAGTTGIRRSVAAWRFDAKCPAAIRRHSPKMSKITEIALTLAPQRV
jgi:hypothetical protein